MQAASYEAHLQSVRAEEVSMAGRNKRELIKREKGKHHLIYFLASIASGCLDAAIVRGAQGTIAEPCAGVRRVCRMQRGRIGARSVKRQDRNLFCKVEFVWHHLRRPEVRPHRPIIRIY